MIFKADSLASEPELQKIVCLLPKEEEAIFPFALKEIPELEIFLLAMAISPFLSVVIEEDFSKRDSNPL